MSTVAQHLPTGTWTIDPVHSTAGFAVKYLGVSTFKSSFKQVDARLQDGVLIGSVQVDSIDIDNPDFKGHVLSPEFFDVANTPTVDFRSDDLDVADDGTITLTGELSIKGVARPVTATGTLAGPTQDPFGNTKLSVQLEAKVNRYEHGLKWNADTPQGGRMLGEDVRLQVELLLVEQAA